MEQSALTGSQGAVPARQEAAGPATARLFTPLTFARGPASSNRFLLAPLTNQQSLENGTLSQDEQTWLTKRAQGGFGMVMTAAAHVQPVGQGFPGQIGIFSDDHIPALSELAQALKAGGALAWVQLHHAGFRAATGIVQAPVAPSEHADAGARALTTDEVEQLREDFIGGALRAQAAGFDGVEVHGAHGYILAQFLASPVNLRDDRYGGSLRNRSRLMFEIIDGIRSRCRNDFQLGVRLSPERYSLDTGEVIEICRRLLAEQTIDFLDLSLWNTSKVPEDARFKGRSLLSSFTELNRGAVRLGAAGKIMDGATAARMLAEGCDFVAIGRAGILRHDFPERVRRNPAYTSPNLPVSVQHLLDEGVGRRFIDYLGQWPGFVQPE